MIERRTAEKVAMWERLVVALVTPLLTITLVRGCSEIDSLDKSVHALAEQQAVTQSRVSDIRDSLGGFYAEAVAERVHSEILRTDKDQYSRLDDHEQRIRNLELD